MSRGVPLTDADRIPWLNSLHEAILRWQAEGRNAVLACSALKRSYRELLTINNDVKLAYLRSTYELLRERLRSRKGHYAGEQLLASQLADLEEPTDAITVDVAGSPAEIVAEIRKRLPLA
jgi:gluconokinase